MSEQTADLIERVANGESADEVISSISPMDEIKGTIHIKGDAVKTNSKYNTPEKAARAIAAYITRKKYGDAEINKRAAKGTKKYFKGKK